MEIICAQEVEKAIRTNTAGEYSSAISQLEKGAALKLRFSEWRRKTPPSYYFLSKYNKGGKKIVSVRRIKDYFLVIKI